MMRQKDMTEGEISVFCLFSVMMRQKDMTEGENFKLQRRHDEAEGHDRG
jgi:hypothetical protein